MRFVEEKRPQGLKPALIPRNLRGPFDKLRAGSEGWLFHRPANFRDFFRSLWRRVSLVP